jgi:predicted HAD superfamily Cof-like phosphohydrolase
MSQFQDDMKKFNEMYKMPVSATPTLEVGVPLLQRLEAFKNILAEELDEIDEIVNKARFYEVESRCPQAAADFHGNSSKPGQTDAEQFITTNKLEILTMLADLLGDIQVYCASEMAKFGLPLDETLRIIMQSNFSKMGADGKPIYDERGKLQKGPNYWKPEPKLTEMLAARFDTLAVDQPIDDHVQITETKDGRKIFSVDVGNMSRDEVADYLKSKM